MPGRVTDPLALRALSHPLRWRLIELLRLEDTATATRCAELTGESVASCSYHLGILAKYGFVELADARGREKPWRIVGRQMTISTEGLDPEAAMAAETVNEVFLDHEFGRMRAAFRRSDLEPEQWRRHVGVRSRNKYLTPDELEEIEQEVWAVLERYAEREDPSARPPGTRPVRLLFATYLPLPPPPAADHPDEGEP